MASQFRQAPLRLYLDTSDYSRFADIGYRNEPGLPEILTFLREKKEQGLIEIRFSGIHVLEFLKDPSQSALALRKVKVMEELCGDRAFRFFSDVFESESEAFRSGSDLAPLVISDKGEWFPLVELGNSTSLDTILQGLEEQLPMFDKAQIRAMIEMPEAAAFVKENMAKELPLANVYDSNLIDRFLLNEISVNELTPDVIRGFTRPSILIEHYLEGSAEAQRVFNLLADSEQKLQQALTRIQAKLKPHMDFVLGLDRNLIKEVRRYVKKLSLSDSSTLYSGLDKLPGHLQESIRNDRFLKELPAVSTQYNVLTAYLRDILYPSPNPPEIKESDAGDILHATYLPYVDLYRTDGRFGALLGKVSMPSTVKVVPKLHQLPEAIEKKLEDRSS